MKRIEKIVKIDIKNISKERLNISSEEFEVIKNEIDEE